MKISTNPLDMMLPAKPSPNTGNVSEDKGFAGFLKDAINEVTSLDQQSAELKQALVTGQVEDVHQVMLASEKAGLAFQLTLQIRNKVVEAYQEIMRMQV